MTIKTNSRPSANVLMLTLLMAFVISTALASYLAFVSHQNQSIARSMTWNASMAIAESGVEEALTQINLCGYTNYVNTNANNWELGTDLWYHKTRSFSDGSYYYVSIHPVDPPVIITSGYVVAPMSTPTFTAFGLLSGQVAEGSSPTLYVNRTVRIVTTRPLSQGTAGFKAKNSINISGGLIDSYNSSLGPYRRLDHAKVMTNSKATGLPSYAISISTAHIYGSVQTGDGGKVFCNTGTVGTTDWNDGNTGVQMSPEEHFTDDADMRFDNVPAPFTSGFNLVPGGTWGGTNVTYKLDTDGDYYYNAPLSPINLGAGKAMIVTGKVRLYTTGNFSVGGSGTSAGFVYIAPGASLELYVTGSFNAAGGGVINGTGATDKLTVYGVNTVLQNASYSGTSGFVGSMYMPNSALTLSGSTVAYGSFSASSIVVNGTTIHIDEALGGSPANGYVVISWNELAPNASLY